MSDPGAAAPRWRPLPALDRRVLGVLVEKAKTTPDVYPLTINALCAGANQKSNRHPLMQVEPDDVEQALDRLRALGAVAIVQGVGRVTKYRHYFYEWLGVDKPESAVMTELLLRGSQTEGELRVRASRMEPITDLTALRQILDGLKAKGLVQSLSPPGRGHVITHTLYEPRELDKVRAEYVNMPPPGSGDTEDDEPPSRWAATHSDTADLGSAEARGESRRMAEPRRDERPLPPSPAAGAATSARLELELSRLRDRVTELESEQESTMAELKRLSRTLDDVRQALGLT